MNKKTRNRIMKIAMLTLPIALSACAPDYVAKKLTGRECNAGYVEDGEDWCAPVQRPTPPQPYCTSSWNGVDCFARPELTPNMAHEVYQGPRGLTQEQNSNRLMMPISKIPPTSQYYSP